MTTYDPEDQAEHRRVLRNDARVRDQERLYRLLPDISVPQSRFLQRETRSTEGMIAEKEVLETRGASPSGTGRALPLLTAANKATTRRRTIAWYITTRPFVALLPYFS